MDGIKITNLKKIIDNKVILNNLSFEIKKGEAIGFIGDNGAGKTTTIKSLIGINNNLGEIIIDNLSVENYIKYKKISYLPEKTYLPDYMSGKEFINYLSELNNIKLTEDKIDQLFKKLNIYQYKNEKIKKYSKGMMQRLCIIGTLIDDSVDYYFFDEPVSGLDPVGQQEIIDIILELKNKGKTIFLTSHQMNEVEEICDRIIFLKKGDIISNTTIKDILKNYKNLREFYVKMSLIKN